ncbi:MAG: NAD(P)-dependent oxidoreductase [Verrucomicrobiae bacterium]|nr:NAD(P)-dependent oxidoreductase [Verrucomicrobiae bacterium]
MNAPGPRILVTGGTGFIGRAIVERLRAEYGDAAVCAQGRSGECALDLLDAASVRSRIPGGAWTHVVHACGCHGRMPERDMFLLHATATQNLLEAFASGPRPTWINIGSASQYGRQDPSTEPLLDERHPDAPASPYGASKIAQETLVLEAAARGLVTPIVLRVFNAIGPGQVGPFAVPFLLAKLMEARSSGPTRITLDRWDAVRDFVDVRDVADAVAAAMRCDRAANQRLNVCSGHGTSLIDLARGLAAAAHVDVLWEPGASVMATGEIPWQCGSPAKILDLTGWRTARPLAQTLANAWAAANR